VSAQPEWSPLDDETADLLSLVADPERVVGRDAVAAFLAACKDDARTHGGEVSVNRVSAALGDAGIEHHRYSSFWSEFTGPGRLMRKAESQKGELVWEAREGSTSGNNGKPMRLRRWIGETA
jgi:hypothetical protein